MTYTHRCKGTCSRSVTLTIEDGVITDCSFEGGCSGNTQGVAKLVIGMEADRAAELLSGLRCGMRGTSCPDQLAQAIREAEQAG